MNSEDRPRYYSVKRGRAFWSPGKFGQLYGFSKSAALGLDGADAKKKAIEWNAKLDAARKAKKDGAPPPPASYPPGSLGSFYEKFQQTEAWEQIEAATRDDYHRTWPVIEARFGQTLITRISPDDSEKFHVDIHPLHDNKKRDPKGKMKLSWNQAHRVLKIWRSLLTALVDYRQIPPPAPIGRISNPAPPGREEVWIFEEVEQLIPKAHELGMHGMALAIAGAWDAMLSPVDARRLKVRGVQRAAGGGEIATRRKKTGKAVHAAVTDFFEQEIERYMELAAGAGLAFTPDDDLIRCDRWKPYTGKWGHKYFQRDFAKVREAAFPGDERQFLDLRRSAATEALMGGADKDDIGTAMSNRLGKDEKLQSTYLVGASRNVHAARVAGRAPMAAKFRNAPE